MELRERFDALLNEMEDTINTGQAALEDAWSHHKAVTNPSIGSHGVYLGVPDDAHREAYEAWYDIYGSLGYVRAFFGGGGKPLDPWSTMQGESWQINPLIRASEWWGATPNIALALIPERDTSVTLAELAKGVHSDKGALLGKRLVDAGLGDALISPGWEGAGDWFLSSYGGNRFGRNPNRNNPDRLWGALDYADAILYRMDAMMSAPGANFRFCLNQSGGWSGDPTRDPMLPYDRLKDRLWGVGPDRYDASYTWYSRMPGTGLSDEQKYNGRMETLYGDKGVATKPEQARGLRFWMDLAERHKKAFVVGECGMWQGVKGGFERGGMDHPEHVDLMADIHVEAERRGIKTVMTWFSVTDPAPSDHRLESFPLSNERHRQRYMR